MVIWWQLSRLLPMIALKTVEKYVVFFFYTSLETVRVARKGYYRSGKAVTGKIYSFFPKLPVQNHKRKRDFHSTRKCHLYMHILPAIKKWKFSDKECLIFPIRPTCPNKNEIALS